MTAMLLLLLAAASGPQVESTNSSFEPSLAGGGFELVATVAPGGGGPADGGDFSLLGTVGQTGSALLVGGEFELQAGIHSSLPTEPQLFGDGFESGSFSAWSGSQP